MQEQFPTSDTGSARIVRSTMRGTSAWEVTIDAAELQRRLHITESDLARVRRFGLRVVERLEVYNEKFYDWVQRQPEWSFFIHDRPRLERVKARQGDHWRDLFQVQAVTDEYIARRFRVGEMHAHIGLPLIAYFAGIDISLRIFLEDLADEAFSESELREMTHAVTKLVHIDAILVLDAYTRLTNQKVAEQAQTLLEMSTPVAALSDNVLMLPVVGIIDSARAQEIMVAVLRSISEARAKVFIIDISGVPVVDTAVANHLIKVMRATRLMGCQSILSGVSPAIAQTMVELGIEVGDVQTKATLRDALETAYDMVGLKLVRVGS
ncbi:MAG: hypothetical protein RIT45_1129 [Pseudomonadota bacterium]|jgi:rsbT co-antagonist protein RsbR